MFSLTGKYLQIQSKYLPFDIQNINFQVENTALRPSHVPQKLYGLAWK